MIDRKEVELLIRANLKGGRDIKDIVQSIEDLEKALTRQADAARKGENSYDELRASISALKAVQDELTSRQRVLRGFEELTKRIQRQQQTVDRARDALDKYVATLGEDRTDKQQQRVQALTERYERSSVAIEQTRQQFENLQAALRQIGIDTGRVADEQKKLDAAVLQTATNLNRGNDELRDFAQNLRTAREQSRALADQQDKLARLQQGNEADARLASQQRLDRIKREEQAEADRLAALTRLGQIEERARTQTVAESELASIREAEKFMRQYAEAKRRAAEIDAGLQKTADQARDAARQYTSLARAATDLRPKTVSLREAVNGIINPAEEARKSIDGVEREVQQLAGEIAQSGGQVANYRETLAQLGAAQRALSQQASLIDTFQKQTQALRGARAELVSARNEVAQYAAAVRQGGEAGQRFVEPLAQAEARLKRASSALREQITATREARTALRDAGVNTSNLADAQRRLNETARATVGALNQLKTASQGAGDGAERVAKGFSLFRDEGRTTLSLAQRIRGEILALAAAYVGLQGVIDLARGSLQAFTQSEGLRNALQFAIGGSPQEVGEQIEYLREQSERIGISFDAAAKGYARFTAAAVKSGAPIQEANFIFESFAEVGRVLNLTPDELRGIFNAVGQSFSKGKIQAEELRQQIGERLPGAFAFAQEALRERFPDLNKALEQGLVGAEELVVIAESVRKAAQGALPAAIKSLDAEQQRFNNSVLFFKKEIADAGFADAYVALLKDLTEFFRSEDGKAFAQGVSDAFSAVITVLRTVLSIFREFGEELKLLALLAAGLAGVSALGRVAQSLGDVIESAKGAKVALTGLQKVLLLLNVALAAFTIGTYLREQFVEVEIAGIQFVNVLLQLWSKIRFSIIELWADFPRLAENGFKAALNAATFFQRKLLGIFGAGARALGLDSLANAVDRAIEGLTVDYNTNISARVAEIRRQADADLEQIRRIGREQQADARAARAQAQRPAASASLDQATPSPGRRQSGNAGPSEADIKKREREIEALTKALETLEAKIDRAQTDTLAKQLEAIDKEYQALARRVSKLGGDQGAEFARRLEEAVAQLKLQTTRKFNDKLLQEQNSLLSKVEQAEAASGRKQRQDLGARLKAVTDSYEAAYRDIEEARQRLLENNRDTSVVDEAKRRLDAAVLELSVAEQQKFFREQIAQQEERINDLLKVREEQIVKIRDAEQAGEINDVQAADRIRAVIAQSQPGIDALAQSSREFAESLRGAVDPVTLDAFIAKIEIARGSGQRLNTQLNETNRILKDGFNRGLTTSIEAALDAVNNLATGVQGLGGAFKSIGRVVLTVLNDIIRQLLVAAIRAAILRAIAGGTPISGGNGLPSGLIPSGVQFHQGGVVGRGGKRRAVDATWFANAPRYHAGGIVGLRPDEYPAILQKNEEVLSKSDPRNIMNGGGMAAAAPQSVRVVLVDDPQRAAEAVAGPAGEQVVMQHVRANVPTIRQWINGR